MPGRRGFLRRRHVFAAAVGLVAGSSRLGWGVLAVLGSLEAEIAGDLVAEGAVLGSQAGVLSAGGIEPLAERVGGRALRGSPGGGRLKLWGAITRVQSLVGWVSRDRQAALRYLLISPLTVVRRLIGAVMSLASPGSCTGG